MAKESASDMIMAAAKLKPLLALSKRDPVQAAIGLTADGEGMIFLDKKAQGRKCAAMMKGIAAKAKLQINPSSVRFGRAEVDTEADPGTVKFTISKAAPGNLRVKLIEVVKRAGFQKVEINVDESLDAEEEGEEQGTEAPEGESSAETRAPDAATLRRELGELIRQVGGVADGGRKAQFAQLAQAANTALKGENIEAAATAIARLRDGLAESPAEGSPGLSPGGGPPGQPPVGGDAAPKGLGAGVIEALYDELTQVEAAVVTGTKPSKPAILAGKFRYARSTIGGAESRLQRVTPEDAVGAKYTKVAVAVKAKNVGSALDAAQERQIKLSLDALNQKVREVLTEASKIRKEAGDIEGLPPDQQAKARADLYLEASDALTEVTRAIADWRGQVKEALPFLQQRSADFSKSIGNLAAAELALGKVVESCLPKLVSRPGKPGEKPPAGSGGATDAPTIGDPLQALKDCGNSWVNAKQKYGANKDEMQKLADYRKMRVDAWLNATLPPWGMENGPGKGWVSVGSADPTSDYDISLNKHGEKGGERRMDYAFVQDFNAWFRQEFGGEGGTVFDTNLYASAAPMVTDPNPEAASTNDVAALMKMRRYMDAGEFEAFRVQTVEACGSDAKQRAKVEQQFDMADNNYRIVVTELIESNVKMLEKRTAARQGKELSEDDKQADMMERAGLKDLTDWLAQGQGMSSGIESYGHIEEGEEYLRVIEHLLKDSSLETTNVVYADKVGEVRVKEQVILALKDLQKALDGAKDKDALAKALETAAGALGKLEVDGADGKKQGFSSAAVDTALASLKSGDERGFEAALSDLTGSLSRELGEHMEQLGTMNTVSRFFANEAYQSDGPFAHVVTATQAAEADATNETVAEATKSTGVVLSEEDVKDKDAKTRIAMLKAGGAAQFKALGETEQGKTEQARLLKEAQDSINVAVKTEKTKRQAAMPAEQCLQSFNEQLGDFLKDLEHYGADEAGKAIVQSSKYLERLLDATRLMDDKQMFADAGSVVAEVDKELALQARVKDELIAARKGNLIMMPEKPGEAVDQIEQRRAYACDFMKQLGVTSIAALAKRYVGFGVRVNAAARKSLAKMGT